MDGYETAGFTALNVQLWPLENSELPSVMTTTTQLPSLPPGLSEGAIAGTVVAIIAVVTIVLVAISVLSAYFW